VIRYLAWPPKAVQRQQGQQQGPFVADRNVVQLVLAGKAAGIVGQVLDVDADEHDPAAVVEGGGVEDRRLLTTGDAPRGPEVQGDRVAAQLAQVELAVADRRREPRRPALGVRPEDAEVESGSGGLLAGGDAGDQG